MNLLNYVPLMLLCLTCLRALLTHLNYSPCTPYSSAFKCAENSIKGKFKTFLIKEEIND